MLKQQAKQFNVYIYSCRYLNSLNSKQKGIKNVKTYAIKSQQQDRQRVVVTGMGLCSVHGNEVDSFYQKLLEGQSGVSRIEGFNTEELPVQIAGEIKNFSVEGLVEPKNARRYDKAINFAIVAAKKALIQAQLEKNYNSQNYKNLDLGRVGCIVGSALGGLEYYEDGNIHMANKLYKKISPFFIPYSITNMPSALVAMEENFMGPNFSVNTACATANNSIVTSANMIRAGEADVMLAGGVDGSVTRVCLGGFIACRALANNFNQEPQKASRPWDQNRSGFILGEGAGVLILESLEHAEKRGANIIAEYLGGALTCDANHITNPREDGKGVQLCIENALKDANVDRDQVNYINAHATSTNLGDIAEIKAIKNVFPNSKQYKVNATKSLIGHAIAASGGLEAIATIKAIQTGEVHPSINQEKSISEVEGIDTVKDVKQKLDVNVGISNSFGFGGHNAVIAFKKFQG